MGRHVSKFVLGPAGVCDACGRFCITLDQAGKRCFHCFAGTFVHRGEWVFSKCPVCNDVGGGWGCQACHGTGIQAVRKLPSDAVSRSGTLPPE